MVGEYEYQVEHLFSHETKYAKEEFEKIVVGAVNNLRNRGIDYTDDYEVIAVLKNIYGFKPYKMPCECELRFDWRISEIRNSV